MGGDETQFNPIFLNKLHLFSAILDVYIVTTVLMALITTGKVPGYVMDINFFLLLKTVTTFNILKTGTSLMELP